MVYGKDIALKVCLPVLGAFSLFSLYIGNVKSGTHTIPEATVSSVDSTLYRNDMWSSYVYEIGFEGIEKTFIFSDWKGGVNKGDTVSNIKYRDRIFSEGKKATGLKVEF